MTTTIDLVRRSGGLKAELIEFARGPRYEPAFREVMSARKGDRNGLRGGNLVDVLDHFVLQYRLPNGQTILEQFVDSRPDLSKPERDMLLGWRDVVEGVFEVVGRDGDALVATSLIDELTYRVRSNIGEEVFRDLPPGSFLYARLVPIGDDWLLSGVMRQIGAALQETAYAIAAKLAWKYPKLLFRNPSLLEQGWKYQRRERDLFVQFFGTDMVLVPGRELTARIREYMAFSHHEVLAQTGQSEDASSPAEMNFPTALVSSEAVAVIYDEIEGLSFFAGADEFEQAFAQPSLLDQCRYRQRVLGYLDDDSVSPLIFRRIAERDPSHASEVLGRVLGQENFDWQRDGETLMRQRKRRFFERAPLPRMLPMNDRLNAHIGGEK